VGETLQNIVTFRVGMQWYGIDVDHVNEILHMVMLNELSSTSPDILGMMLVRDSVVPVIDLRLRFGIVEPKFHLDTPIITVRAPQGITGLIVDEVDNVEHISADQITVNLSKSFPYVAGTTQLRDTLLLLVDVAMVASLAGSNLAKLG
jgi:purine-binding chemotaxis protein CheW